MIPILLAAGSGAPAANRGSTRLGASWVGAGIALGPHVAEASSPWNTVRQAGHLSKPYFKQWMFFIDIVEQMLRPFKTK